MENTVLADADGVPSWVGCGLSMVFDDTEAGCSRSLRSCCRSRLWPLGRRGAEQSAVLCFAGPTPDLGDEAAVLADEFVPSSLARVLNSSSNYAFDRVFQARQLSEQCADLGDLLRGGVLEFCRVLKGAAPAGPHSDPMWNTKMFTEDDRPVGWSSTGQVRTGWSVCTPGPPAVGRQVAQDAPGWVAMASSRNSTRSTRA